MFANIFKFLSAPPPFYDKPFSRIFIEYFFSPFPLPNITRPCFCLFFVAFFAPYSAAYLCHLLPLSAVPVWVEVMFESDNVRELKTEGGSAPLQFILALHPLCTFCDYFWNIRLTTPTRQTALTEIDSKCRHPSKMTWLADDGHLAGARGPRARRVAAPKLDVGRAGSRRE